MNLNSERSRPGGRWLIGILAVYVLLFARAASFEFVWDDAPAFLGNPLFEAPLLESSRATMSDLIDPSLARNLSYAYESYRPLLLASYKLDQLLFAFSPVAMHVHSLILGALCVALVFALAGRILPGRVWPLFVTGVFALHPLQIEPLCHISARADVLSALLALLSALLLLNASSESAPGSRAVRALWTLGSCLAFLASLLAKESQIGLPLALGLLLLAAGKLRGSLVPLMWLSCTVPVYAALRTLLVGDGLSGVDPATAALALWTLPGIVLQYFAVFLLPTDLSIERGLDPGIPAALAWLGVLAVSMLFLQALRDRLGSWSHGVRWGAAGLGVSLVLLGPAAVPAVTNGVLADRYAYLAVLGLAVSLGALGSTLWRQMPNLQPGFGVGAGVWAALLGMLSWRQVPVWQNEAHLFTNSVLVEPESSMAHFRFGALRAKQREWPEAAGSFESAIALDPGNARAFHALGVSYLFLNRLEEAEHTAAIAVAMRGGRDALYWYDLAIVRISMAEARTEDLHTLDRGCAALERVLRLKPEFTKALETRARYCGESETLPRGVTH